MRWSLAVARRRLRPALVGYLILTCGLGVALAREQTVINEQARDRCIAAQQSRRGIIDGLDSMIYALTDLTPGANAALDAKIANGNAKLPQPPKKCP